MPGTEIIRDVAEGLRLLASDKRVAIDLETGGLSPWRDPLAVVTMYGSESRTPVVIHCRGRLPPTLVKYLNTSRQLFIGHNVGGFDGLFLSQNGVDAPRMQWYDTFVGEAVTLASGRHGLSVSLKASIQRRLGRKIKKDQQVSTWMADHLTDEQLAYCADDVRHLPELMDAQLTKAGYTSVRSALKLEMSVLPVVMRMTLNGMPLREGRLREYRDLMEEQARETSAELSELFGGPCNMNSPAQVKRGLTRCGIDLPSTAKPFLQDIALMGGRAGEICELLLNNRYAEQRLKMYSDEWLATHVVADGRVHPRIWQCGTETGRMSMSDPNMQQVPRDMRFVFGEDGMRVVWADYGQIEVRIAAAIARDQAMLGALESDDVHSAVASQVFEIPQDSVTPEQRKRSKAMTFTLLFGGGVQTLYNYARLSGSDITRDGARLAHERFFTTYQGLHAMKVRAQAQADGGRPVAITLPTGMRRVLFGSNLAATVILNTSVQGTAAAGIKYALVECRRRGLDKYLALQVHDELVSVVPPTEVEEYKRELVEAMIVGMSRVISAPVRVDVADGDEWGN